MENSDVKRVSSGIAPVIVMVVMLVLSLYLLSAATRHPEKFGELYPTLLVVTIVELLILFALIVSNILRLIRQYRSQATGSRLSVRLIITFVVLAVGPVSIVYYFSSDFIRRVIDNWFDVRVESALGDALKLSRVALDERMQEELKIVKRMEHDIAMASDNQLSYLLDELRQKTDASEITLMTLGGRIIATANVNAGTIVPNYPHETVMLQVRQGRPFVGLDPSRDTGLSIRVVIPVSRMEPLPQTLALQVLFPVTERLNQLAESVQRGYSQYEELQFLREPLKLTFLATLSIVLFLTLFTAVWAAFYSARKLVAPIRVLAIGTRSVAAGDYGKRLPLTSNDELGFLVQSFNDMTEKLARARDEAGRSQRRAEEQKAYLETVLGRLSSGVMVLNRERMLRTVNAVANAILGINLGEHTGQTLDDIVARYPMLENFARAVEPHLARDETEWREEIMIFGASGRQVLMCRGAVLFGQGDRGGHVIVFDDITAVIQSQRDAAWGEVARRLAHEIKNPLTPIQLAAERLRHKYLKSMTAEDAEVLDRATNTIVQQVEVMKEMVKAFSDYALPPKLRLEPLQLNELIDAVLDLYRNEQGLIEIQTQLAEDLPSIQADSGRLRQLLLNLVKNAIEATPEGSPTKISIATNVVHRDGLSFVELAVTDNGPGIKPELLSQLFEPYFTTKPKGSGLGLAIVKKIVEEHSGIIRAENLPEGGACFVINLPLDETVRAGDVGARQSDGLNHHWAGGMGPGTQAKVQNE